MQHTNFYHLRYIYAHVYIQVHLSLYLYKKASIFCKPWYRDLISKVWFQYGYVAVTIANALQSMFFYISLLSVCHCMTQISFRVINLCGLQEEGLSLQFFLLKLSCLKEELSLQFFLNKTDWSLNYMTSSKCFSI